MLRAKNLNVYCGNLQVLRNISIDVNEGELVTLIGNNGAGKTTLLMTLCGILKQASGTIELLGTNLGKLPPHRIFKSGIVQVTQDGGIFNKMTVLENLKEGAYRSPSVKSINKKLEEIYSYFQVLAERSNQQAGTLS